MAVAQAVQIEKVEEMGGGTRFAVNFYFSGQDHLLKNTKFKVFEVKSEEDHFRSTYLMKRGIQTSWQLYFEDKLPIKVPPIPKK